MHFPLDAIHQLQSHIFLSYFRFAVEKMRSELNPISVEI